ncbi:hypothetical protein M758_8G072300 [Ceratodon purpureus]|nr:hypothetical protein M758_8G072300 [Ceratodon purpureus]
MEDVDDVHIFEEVDDEQLLEDLENCVRDGQMHLDDTKDKLSKLLSPRMDYGELKYLYESYSGCIDSEDAFKENLSNLLPSNLGLEVDKKKLQKDLENCVCDGQMNLDDTKDKLSKLLGPRVDYGKLKDLYKLCVRKDGEGAFIEKLSKFLGNLGLEVDDEKLKELRKCKSGSGVSGFKDKLLKLYPGLNFEGYTKTVLIRAKLYSRLIAVALSLTPQDIGKEEGTPQGTLEQDWTPQSIGKGKAKNGRVVFGGAGAKLMKRLADEGCGLRRYLLKVVLKKDDDFMAAHGVKSIERLADEGCGLLRYLLKEVLEEDDEFMTVLFCNSKTFKKYPVPYFEGCTPDVIDKVQSLWLSHPVVLEEFYFRPLIKPIIDMVKDYKPPTDPDFIEAKLKVCQHLHERQLKAGARLFWLVCKERGGRKSREGRATHKMIGRLVKEIFNTKAAGEHNWDFQDNFFSLWEKYWHNLDLLDSDIRTDRVYVGHVQPICVGLISSPAHTDGNLLCWAARRNYHDLIWCVMQEYKPPESHADSDDDWIDSERTFAWKMALWCSTRQGDFWRVVRELSIPKWTREIDFNDYPSGWLPPMHLAAILGDMDRMETLCKYLHNVQSRGNKKDYLGRTPLDYAMQFQRRIAEPSRKGKDVIRKLLSMEGADERLQELYDMYIHQANTVLIGAALIASVTFAGWLQPPLGFRDYFQFTRPGPSPADGNIYYESYVAIEGHRGIEVFIVFNTISFFLSIATVLVGAEATLFIHDGDEKTSNLIRMRKSIKWMIGFFISSMLCIMAAFTSAGMTILPPIQRLEWSMIISLVVGGGICIIPLCWIAWSLNRNYILLVIETKPICKRILNMIKSRSSKEKNDSLEETDPESDLSDQSLIDLQQVKRLRHALDKSIEKSEGDQHSLRKKEKKRFSPSERSNNLLSKFNENANPQERGQDDASPHDSENNLEESSQKRMLTFKTGKRNMPTFKKDIKIQRTSRLKK